jgi:hypothetical protein
LHRVIVRDFAATNLGATDRLRRRDCRQMLSE